MRAVAWWGLILGIAVANRCFGQAPSPGAPPATPPSPSATPPDSSPAVTESKLGGIVVKDENGVLVPYPLVTLEELDRLLDMKGERKTEAPSFSFAPGATIQGTVQGSNAELQVKFQVELNSIGKRTADWVRIPVHLNQTVLLPPVEHTGPGEFLLEFAPRGDGYVLWLRAEQGTKHTFAIRVKVPFTTRNGFHQLALTIPDAPTTQMKLTVPGSATEARVNGLGNILTTGRQQNGQTELVVDAAGGDVDLSWRELEELPPVLAAFGNIGVSFDGLRFEFDARLSVRSYGSPIDSFVVRLPPNTDHIVTDQYSQTGLEYSLLPDKPETGGARHVLVRRIEGKTAAVIEAHLRCQSSKDVVDSESPWQLGGFEVLGARQQKGTVDFQVEGDWTVEKWLTDSSIRQVDDVPDVNRQQQSAARFEYDRQPFSLQPTIREKKTRITVEPTWVVSVAADQLSLSGTVKYRITGTRAKPLEVETGGWTISDVGPGELVGDGWRVEGTKLIVQLAPSVPLGGGEFELQIIGAREHRSQELLAAGAARWPREPIPNLWMVDPAPPLGPASLLRWLLQERSHELAFQLPRPVADAGLAALVIVAPRDNIELTAAPDRSRGLVADTLPAEITVTGQQQPLVYREDIGLPLTEFSGQFRVRPQAVSVTVESRVKIDERGETQVDQEFSHTILNDPIRQLRFLVPSSLVDSGRLELLVDTIATPWTRPPSPAESASTHTLVTVDLRDPRIGTLKALFKYRQPRPRMPDKEPLELQLPLIQLALEESTTLVSHRLRVARPANLAVTASEDVWTELISDPSVAPNELLFESHELPSWLRLELTRASAPAKRSTDVHRVWVQSLLTVRERRERACFRLSTNEPSLIFQLPAGVIHESGFTMAIDGQRVDRFTVSSRGELRVELGEGTGTREMTIEIWYWFRVNQVGLGRLHLQSPVLDGAARADRVYWQLLLPNDEYLAWYPNSLTSENRWRRSNLLFGRVPRRDQPDLEQWVSASSQRDLTQDIPTGFNTYLFSSIGTPGVNSVYTITRSLAAFGVAGCVFLAGAGLLYIPILRHPLLLLGAGLATACCAIVFPEPALAAAQLTALGLALVLLVGVLRSWLPSRTLPARGTWRAPSGMTSDPRSTNKHTQSRAASPSSHVTTATLSGRAPLQTTGNET